MFLVLFSFEFGLRLVASEMAIFWTGQDASWNVFDACNIFFAAVDIIFQISDVDFVSVLPLMRLFRLIRIVRVLRLSKFHVLRTLISMFHALKVSAGAFLPAMILLAVTMYIFGVAFMQGVVLFLRDNDDSETAGELKDYFPSVTASIWTLTAAVLGGYDWADIGKPVSKIGIIYTVLWIFFVIFTILAVLNILTGIFVNCSQQMSKMTREIVTDTAMEEAAAFQVQMVDLFMSADATPDGILSESEFHSLFEDDRDAAFLGSFGLDSHAAAALFSVIDQDGSGGIELIEFIELCTTMKGPVKVLHYRLLQQNLHTVLEGMADLSAQIVGLKAASALQTGTPATQTQSEVRDGAVEGFKARHGGCFPEERNRAASTLTPEAAKNFQKHKKRLTSK
jgi:hypothetical protein